MEQAKDLKQHVEAFVEEARVVAASAHGFSITAGDVRAEAKRAVGCLVEPAVDDRVLVAWLGSEVFILNVLERARVGTCRLTAPGDLEIAAPGGAIALTAARGVDVTTAEEVSITSRALKLRSLEADVLVERVKAFGATIETEFERVTSFARRVDRVVGILREQAAQVFRRVEGVDQLRAGEVDLQASNVARIHAKNTLMTADDLVKLDGGQVHLG